MSNTVFLRDLTALSRKHGVVLDWGDECLCVEPLKSQHSQGAYVESKGGEIAWLIDGLSQCEWDLERERPAREKREKIRQAIQLQKQSAAAYAIVKECVDKENYGTGRSWQRTAAKESRQARNLLFDLVGARS